jgi:DNA-binding CsgD family transcriptional regulator
MKRSKRNLELNQKDVEIMALVKAGLSAKEISQHLSRSQRAVEKHLISVRLKLNAKNIAHAVALFIESYQARDFCDAE